MLEQATVRLLAVGLTVLEPAPVRLLAVGLTVLEQTCNVESESLGTRLWEMYMLCTVQ